MVGLNEARAYLRIDSEDDDKIIKDLLDTAIQLCTDIARCETKEQLFKSDYGDTVVLYALGYLYEHREEADHHELVMSLRYLLSPLREGVL